MEISKMRISIFRNDGVARGFPNFIITKRWRRSGNAQFRASHKSDGMISEMSQDPPFYTTDTRMRQSITPLERLSVTLRYLATGNTFEDLKFLCAISAQTIGRIVVETCSSSRLFGIKNFFLFFSKIGSKSI